MSGPRHLRISAPRLDEVVHHVLQSAVLGLIREDSPNLAAIEDVRLALDEVLLADAILQGNAVDVDIASSSDGVVIDVVVDATELPMHRSALRALVDAIEVSSQDGATTVTLRHRWAHDHVDQDHPEGNP